MGFLSRREFDPNPFPESTHQQADKPPAPPTIRSSREFRILFNLPLCLHIQFNSSTMDLLVGDFLGSHRARAEDASNLPVGSGENCDNWATVRSPNAGAGRRLGTPVPGLTEVVAGLAGRAVRGKDLLV